MADAAGWLMVAAADEAAQRQALQAADAAWDVYARARGMQHRAGRFGWAHAQWPRVDGAVEGLAVALELVWREDGARTAALAVPPSPMAGNLEITREGLADRISKLFGAQDVVLGDEAFDRAFRVKSTPEALAHALLSAGVRAEMLAASVRRLAYDDGSHAGHCPMVLVEVPGVATDPAGLDRLLGMATELARVQQPLRPYR